MDRFGTSRGDEPAFNLLEPAQRVVMGAIAAIGVAAASYFIFVPLSDASAIQLARRGDAGSSGYAGGNERVAAAGRRAAGGAKASLRPAEAQTQMQAQRQEQTQTAGMKREAAAPI